MRTPVRRTRRSSADEASESIRELAVPYLRAERRRLTLIAIAAILGGFAEAGMLVLVARIAFALSSSHSTVSTSIGPIDISLSVADLLLIAGVLVALRIALQVLQTVLSARATFDTVDRERKRLIQQYLAASWAIQATQREGRLQELLTTYAGATSGTINSITQTGIAAFNLTALLVTALAVSAIASVSAAVAALLIGLALRPLRAAVRRRSSRAADAGLEFATGLTELTSTLQEVRVFDVAPNVQRRLNSLADTAARRSTSTAYVSGSIQVLYQGMAMSLIIGALAIAYAADITGVATLGAIVLILLRSLSYAQAVQSGIQGLHENAPYLQTLHREADRFDAAALPAGGRHVERVGVIAFEDVSFEYEADVPVLVDLSFVVEPGEIIGIVGPSGSGKSTLTQLLLRLRNPTSGRITANGVDLDDIALGSWYGHVSFVPQDARLFSGTVGDNIRFYREDVAKEEIERAARGAHIHDDIVQWRLGYDTPVGERGSQLSGGQRQRLCIARALVGCPEVVILDEPTSALDVRSESLMRDTMEQLAPRSTVFVVAHRLSTLSICDRIMVILGGRLQAFDRPDRLESADPFYAEALRLSGMR